MPVPAAGRVVSIPEMVVLSMFRRNPEAITGCAWNVGDES